MEVWVDKKIYLQIIGNDIGKGQQVIYLQNVVTSNNNQQSDIYSAKIINHDQGVDSQNVIYETTTNTSGNVCNNINNNSMEEQQQSNGIDKNEGEQIVITINGMVENTGNESQVRIILDRFDFFFFLIKCITFI